MQAINTPAGFITNWFSYNGDQYKIACTPEFKLSKGELDFTGNFIGILISAEKGSQVFIEDRHPDKIFICPKFPLDAAPADFPEQLIIHSFDYNGDVYRLAIVPGFGAWEQGRGLDFSGCYEGVLLSNRTGTIIFQVEPSGDDLEVMAEGIESPVADKIINIIKEFRAQETMA